MKIAVFAQEDTPRLRYTLQIVLEIALGTDWVLVTDPEVFSRFPGPCINYSTLTLSEPEVRLHPVDLLFGKGVRELPLATFWQDDLPAFFGVPPGADLSFDPLACSFFMLSRYEEYLPFVPDEHGRFGADLSLAGRSGFLELPVVMLWAKRIGALIQEKFPRWTPQRPGYRFIPTYDVDMPWAYRYRSWRGWGRALLDLMQGDFRQTKARLQVLTGRRQDPFFTFDRLAEWHQEIPERPVCFWLLGDPSREDVNPSHRIAAYRQLICEHAQECIVGIHPSYQSFDQEVVLQREIERLAAITGQKVEHSRQHFLRLRFPQTYRMLLAAGIRHDYSMGYADAVGYRAGMTEPFPWYDLLHETPTDLWVHPFVAMDVTLRLYQKCSPAAARTQLLALREHCQGQQWTFSTLWHNSSFSEFHGWQGWSAVYAALFSDSPGRSYSINQ